MGKWNEALKAWERAMERKPNGFWYKHSVVMCLLNFLDLEIRDAKRAHTLSLALVAQGNGSGISVHLGAAFRILGQARTHNGDYSGAIEALNRTIKANYHRKARNHQPPAEPVV